ncbi:hypothetical protein DMN91_011401 [Ooceraea biroi]|uniref:DUF4773 domain-containing protein n=1 Tax=Ooceraea biroi TaxID=2015173 RepID=A0A3L8D581_OOCBI|nr:coiled-coil domain-containing protein 1 [Ooceraea biroi]RLU15647.1 hypothetical protein DMN91_011401 [Ooceraea biroi]
MRLSTIFELLLILLLVAFAAYGRVIDRDEVIHQRVVRATNNAKQGDMELSTMSLKQAADSVNRYCTCNENICNCCRDFHIPLVQLKGPGCASLQYLQGDNLAVQLSFGENILTSTIVNGKSPRPVCVPLPGGFTKFCGRIYSIQRDAKNHFKACLGLELQSATELEASLRVSCFRFGPDGLKLRPAEPLPVVEAEASEEDDDDDFFGLGSDDDDDDDDEDDERPSLNTVSDASGSNDPQESDDDDDDEEDDLLGFSALLDIFTGGEDSTTKKPKVTTVAPLLEFTIPILTRPTTPVPLEEHDLSTVANNVPIEESNEDEHENTQEPVKDSEEEDTGLTESNTEDTENTDENQDEVTEASNKIVYITKPDKGTTNKVKKGVTNQKKKPSVTSTSVNAIENVEKPVKRPIKDEEDDDDILEDDEDDIDEEEEEDDEPLDDDDDKYDEDEEDEDELDDEKNEEHDDDEDLKAEDLDDLDDDDDEEEDTMLSALIGTGKSKKDKGNSTTSSPADSDEDDSDEDYDDLGLDFLARKRHPSGTRQSKVTRL